MSVSFVPGWCICAVSRINEHLFQDLCADTQGGLRGGYIRLLDTIYSIRLGSRATGNKSVKYLDSYPFNTSDTLKSMPGPGRYSTRKTTGQPPTGTRAPTHACQPTDPHPPTNPSTNPPTHPPTRPMHLQTKMKRTNTRRFCPPEACTLLKYVLLSDKMTSYSTHTKLL